ncbi:hypothetical protein PDE_09039 [Penicillium oxalicum 114-2]|uniref:Uncharacterized protein n=1 Tax=Penicillium oxalicum (strain 114-2 / CGMCC 5302) TaxID=933388 RepID=S8BG36_PENO1|nr:hypothetical protein PDE_09039 [Penicillium oxalicum 114-2]
MHSNITEHDGPRMCDASFARYPHTICRDSSYSLARGSAGMLSAYMRAPSKISRCDPFAAQALQDRWGKAAHTDHIHTVFQYDIQVVPTKYSEQLSSYRHAQSPGRRAN